MIDGEILFYAISIKRLKKERTEHFAKKAWCRPSSAR